ncbi:MAG: hypothetical protein ABIR46_03585 [Candidatus Saccharimonadales bacterium]
MASKATSFNRHKLKTVLKRNAHFRNVRQTSRKRDPERNASPHADESFERELQSFLYDVLVQVSNLRMKSFLVAWAGGHDPEHFDLYSHLFSKCLVGRWNVAVVDDVDGKGARGWHISQF